MKVIQAMKQVKANKDQIADLQAKIAQHCANLSFETPVYGSETPKKIAGWIQSCRDLSRDNIKLLTAIARTNLETMVTINLGGKDVTKTIAEWVWRRREYAKLDGDIFRRLTDRGLKEGQLPSSVPGGAAIEAKIVRHYDPEQRDIMLAMYQSEPSKIDAELEVINAITDLVEEPLANVLQRKE